MKLIHDYILAGTVFSNDMHRIVQQVSPHSTLSIRAVASLGQDIDADEHITRSVRPLYEVRFPDGTANQYRRLVRLVNAVQKYAPHFVPDLYYTVRSIHPQGWVPIETWNSCCVFRSSSGATVAFTPKGGCPLKRTQVPSAKFHPPRNWCSIHPQGWVPIETRYLQAHHCTRFRTLVAFTPKGGCPLKHRSWVSP